MATIHVNTDTMRNLGYVFLQLNEQLTNRVFNYIQSTTSHLEGDWQGISRQHYEQLIQQWRAAAQQVITSGENIGKHLQNTANQFDSADRSL